MGKPARARCLTSLEPVPSALDGRDETGLECVLFGFCMPGFPKAPFSLELLKGGVWSSEPYMDRAG